MSDEILARHVRGELSAPMALMELLTEHEDLARVAAIVAHDAPLAALLAQHHAGCARIVAMLRSGVDSPAPAASVDEGIAAARRLFDWSVQQSEEASVALYSLGSAELLAAATAELVAWLRKEGLVAPSTRALQIGCGIGRMEAALAPHLAHATGIDVSERMIEAASRRCAHLANVTFSACSGRDLAGHAAAAFDLVYAVDSFPYLVQAGHALVRAHFQEARRVLVPGGRLAILGYSYRGLEEDRRDVAALAAEAGLAVVHDGVRPSSLWSGAAFVMTR